MTTPAPSGYTVTVDGITYSPTGRNLEDTRAKYRSTSTADLARIITAAIGPHRRLDRAELLIIAADLEGAEVTR